MKTACKCRYDAAGHKILPPEDMLHYYKNDPVSVDVLRRNMPHRYVCLPVIEIHILSGPPLRLAIFFVYPGESREIERIPSQRALEGLRATYRGRRGWSTRKNAYGAVVLRREGRVILDPRKRYGIWR